MGRRLPEAKGPRGVEVGAGFGGGGGEAGVVHVVVDDEVPRARRRSVALPQDKSVTCPLSCCRVATWMKGFEANDNAESDGIRVDGRQLVSQTPRKLALLKVEVILVWDLAWMLAQQDAKVVLF